MRFVFWVSFLVICAGVAYFFILQTPPQTASAQSNPNVPAYERYKGNTEAKQTWPDSADEMVLVNVQGARPYFIDRYEATISQGRAWSVPGLTPTTRLTSKDAKSACATSGKRLCTTEEWRIACRDGRAQPYYYKNTQELARKCDWARSGGYDSKDYANKNNTHPACATPRLGIHHIIGNVVEMTQGENNATQILGMSYLGLKYYGAGFKDENRALQMSCEYTVMKTYPTGRRNEGLGFRCCKDAR